jgi:hypothetical protein
MNGNNVDSSISIAAALSEDADYISAAIPSVNMKMNDYYEQFRKDTSSYFENVLQNLQRIHEDAFERREQELYRQIAELQGQLLDHQEQLTAMTEKCSRQQAELDKHREKSIDRQLKKYKTHTSPWSLKKLFLAWKILTKRGKQRVKTDKFLHRWEKKFYSLQMFAMWSHGHKILKYDHSLSENKFKYETLSNEMIAHYENDQSKLQSDLRDAYALVKKEEQKRLQLEGAMRTMFLKNMTSMNMEALNIFHSINKFDPSDILESHNAFQPQQQQPQLNSKSPMAASELSTGGNGDVSVNTKSNSNNYPTDTSQFQNSYPDSSVAATMSSSDSNITSGNSLNNAHPGSNVMYSASMMQPAVPLNNQYQPQGMLSNNIPLPINIGTGSYPYSTQQQPFFNQSLPQQQAMRSTPSSVRFEVPSMTGAYSTPNKISAQIDISNVQDREYFERLSEQYHQATAPRFTQNAPVQFVQPSIVTPVRGSSHVSRPGGSSHQQPTFSAHTTPTHSSAGPVNSSLSGYHIRRK